MADIFVAGAGGFGTALAIMCAKFEHRVTLWSKFPEEVEQLTSAGEHVRLLPGIPIPESVEITCDIKKAARAQLIIIATPSGAVREVSRALAPHCSGSAVIACVSKGFESETLYTMSQVMEEEFKANSCVILSGPSHAEEIAKDIPSAITAASHNRAAAEFVQDTLSNSTLRIYVNDDVTGVELGGALKNVIALAAGVLDGLKLGDNSKAALMTRGLTEMARLGVACGAQSETFAGLAGVGDLIVTCTSLHSRNRRAGILIGSGKSPKEAIEQIGMTVEGYFSAKNAYELALRHNVDMPIFTQVYKVIYENQSTYKALEELMGRPKRHESEQVWLLSREGL